MFDSWKQARHFLQVLEGRFVFRGVSNVCWDLLTTLNRAAQYRSADAEEVLIDSFRKALPALTSDVPDAVDTLSWRALMRHYGLPSRLLDCTESYAVAAYFAINPPPESAFFTIWAFNKDALQNSAGSQLIGLSNAPPLVPTDLGDPRIFEIAANTGKHFVTLADPRQKTKRQEAQQGVFLLPADPGFPFWRNLEPICNISNSIYQLLLPNALFPEVQNYLRDKRIDRVDLLPDVDNLETLSMKLKDLLVESQRQYGQFEWGIRVKRNIMDKSRGLLDLEVKSRKTLS